MMMMRILSNEELYEIETRVDKFGDSIIDYATTIEKVIELFNDDQVVQSFYMAGSFGDEKKQKLMEISLALREYANDMARNERSLVAETKRYIAGARNLNDSRNALESVMR